MKEESLFELVYHYMKILPGGFPLTRCLLYRSLACNYRPVSLTCVPCKLLEHIVCSNIMAHLDEHKLLSDKQHAFRKWHSCETQLATVINDWAKILDNQEAGQLGP